MLQAIVYTSNAGSAARYAKMLAQATGLPVCALAEARRGLAQEVRALQKAGVPRDAQAMQAIGYKEICEALAGECTMEKAFALVNIHTRQYAKKQMTWLARDNDVRWLDGDAFESARALHEKMIEEIRSCQEERKHEAE